MKLLQRLKNLFTKRTRPANTPCETSNTVILNNKTIKVKRTAFGTFLDEDNNTPKSTPQSHQK